MTISEKKLYKIENSGTVSSIFAILHLVFWGFATIVCILALFCGEPFSAFINPFLGSIGLTAVGVIWLTNARYQIRIRKMCMKYVGVLRDNSTITISRIGIILQEDVKQVRKDLCYLINNRCIEGVRYISKGDCVVNNHIPQTVSDQMSASKSAENSNGRGQQTVPEKANTSARVSVICRCCCGITVLPINTVGICDYCGSKIKS